MIVLDKDAYDALELSALAFNGIGAGRWFEGECDSWGRRPCCVYGHAVSAHGRDDAMDAILGHDRPALVRVLEVAGITEGESDWAVSNVNRHNGRPHDARVTFAEWCAELGVVRGE